MTAAETATTRFALSRGTSVTYAAAMADEPEDSALMLRYRDGDLAAFETLYRRHNDALYRYLLRRCRIRAAAEDVFQEVWTKIIRARDRYRPTAKFSTFLYRVAHNCYIDYLRRNRRHLQAVDVDPDTQSGDQPEAADEADLALARRQLEAALSDLPDEQRDTFLLYEEAGLTLDQIAEVTGVKRETAKSRLRYAVNKLKAALHDELAPHGETQ